MGAHSGQKLETKRSGGTWRGMRAERGNNEVRILLKLRGKGRGIVVDLVEEVRQMQPTRRAIELVVVAGGEGHVVLVVIETGGRVVAGRHVHVLAQGRCVTVAVDDGEPGPGAVVAGVLHTGLGAVGPRGIPVRVPTGRAGELHRLDWSGRGIQLDYQHGDLVSDSEARITGMHVFRGGPTTCSSGGISLRSIPAEDLEARGKGHDLVVSGLEATMTMIINLTCSIRLAKACALTSSKRSCKRGALS